MHGRLTGVKPVGEHGTGGDGDAPHQNTDLPINNRLPMMRRALNLVLAAAAAVPLAQALRTFSAEPRLGAALALASGAALALSFYSLVRETCGVSAWLRRLGFSVGLITCGGAVGLWLLLSQLTLKSVPREDIVLLARVTRAADVALWLAAALVLGALATALLPPQARSAVSSHPPGPRLS